jgi:hypothetical protein
VEVRSVKTTLEMPDELFRRAKAVAARRGQSLKQLVTTAVERELSTPAQEGAGSKRRKAAIDASLGELEALSRRIREAWPEGVTAVEAIREQRRDL